VSAQQRAFDPGPALAGLSDRQTIVLQYLQANPQGARAIDAGNHLHRAKRNPCLYCSDGRTCAYASRDALDVLKSLRDRQLVRYRGRLGVWQAVVVDRRIVIRRPRVGMIRPNTGRYWSASWMSTTGGQSPRCPTV
jgi:hypothetical protein